MRVKEGNACRIVTGCLPLDVAVIRVSSPASKLLPGESAQMLPPAGLAPVSILLGGGRHAGEGASSSPGAWVSGPVFLRQKRQDRDGLVRGAPNFPIVEQKGQKELSWMGPEDKDSCVLLKEAEWVTG